MKNNEVDLHVLIWKSLCDILITDKKQNEKQPACRGPLIVCQNLHGSDLDD